MNEKWLGRFGRIKMSSWLSAQRWLWLFLNIWCLFDLFMFPLLFALFYTKHLTNKNRLKNKGRRLFPEVISLCFYTRGESCCVASCCICIPELRCMRPRCLQERPSGEQVVCNRSWSPSSGVSWNSARRRPIPLALKTFEDKYNGRNVSWREGTITKISVCLQV